MDQPIQWKPDRHTQTGRFSLKISTQLQKQHEKQQCKFWANYTNVKQPSTVTHHIVGKKKKKIHLLVLWLTYLFTFFLWTPNLGKIACTLHTVLAHDSIMIDHFQPKSNIWYWRPKKWLTRKWQLFKCRERNQIFLSRQ